MVVVALAVCLVLVGILVACLAVQRRIIRNLRLALDTATRAVSREHAAAEIARSELAHLSVAAQVRTLWLTRNPVLDPWLS